jgi:hypothetical protein
MARGWESKSVEAQMEDAASRRSTRQEIPLTVEQIRVQRERESLEMARARVLRDLESATHARYREQLQSALEFLEQKLAACQES